jgi:hypothetical protein
VVPVDVVLVAVAVAEVLAAPAVALDACDVAAEPAAAELVPELLDDPPQPARAVAASTTSAVAPAPRRAAIRALASPQTVIGASVYL